MAWGPAKGKIRANPVTWVWTVGIVLAVLVYLSGPEHFMYLAYDVVTQFQDALRRFTYNLTSASYDVIRAAAIGLFIIFVVLSLMAISAGKKGKLALIFVSLLFWLLVWNHPGYGWTHNWVGALLVALCGAIVMTRRVRS